MDPDTWEALLIMSTDFIGLPKPDDRKKRKPKKLKECPDCKIPLITYPGWGSCESCHRGMSLPIWRIASTGRQRGKEVHLASMVLRELSQDVILADAKEDLLDELDEKHYFIVWDMEERMP